jgi:hypothetical protein
MNKTIKYTDISLYLVGFILLGVIRHDILFIVAYFLLYPYLTITKRKKEITYLIVASVISLIWVLFANKQYGYNKEVFFVFGLNTAPLFAWAVGLFAIYFLYSAIEKKLYLKNIFTQTGVFITLYWTLLITIETIGYHVFDIKNLTAAMYSGLPLCNCIHAPLWMQIAYFLIGPMYFCVIKLMIVKNSKKKQIFKE